MSISDERDISFICLFREWYVRFNKSNNEFGGYNCIRWQSVKSSKIPPTKYALCLIF